MSFERRYQEHWTSRLAAGEAGGHNEIFETALSALRPGGALLDAGCGSGGFLALAAPLFNVARGVDLAPAAAEAARGKGLDARQADLASGLPFSDRVFDACVLLDVLEHVADPAAALRELRRVLKPGGQLVLSTPNIRCFRNIWRLAVEGEFPRTTADDFVWGGGHLHYFTRRDAAALLEGAGFAGVSFVLNPGQFGRSLKRRLLRLAAGERLFGEFIEGSVVASCHRSDQNG